MTWGDPGWPLTTRGFPLHWLHTSKWTKDTGTNLIIQLVKNPRRSYPSLPPQPHPPRWTQNCDSPSGMQGASCRAAVPDLRASRPVSESQLHPSSICYLRKFLNPSVCVSVCVCVRVCVCARTFVCLVVSDFLQPHSKEYFVFCSLPGSSVHRIFQVPILEWVAILPPGDLPHPEIKPASLESPALALHWIKWGLGTKWSLRNIYL